MTFSPLFHHQNTPNEKKVEYIELIYDLIFVYLISRNGDLLHTIENGFVTPSAYFTYLCSTLIILQIWYFSMLFINRFGDGRISEYAGIFVNMYLMYFMADGIQADWGQTYLQYNLAWALILLNLALQYYLRLLQTGEDAPLLRSHIRYHMVLLVVQAVLILVSIPIYYTTGASLSPWSLVIGILVPLIMREKDTLVPIDFSHLSERVMLYVVFTFGEMILAITGYFDGGLSFNTLYFSLMAFLIVAGLFTSYGYFYDHLLDQEMVTSGNSYMLLHMVMITALGHITCGMEFMPNPSILAVPKNIFLTASILVYYICLLLTQPYSKKQLRGGRRSRSLLLAVFLLYAVLTALTYRNGYLGIALTVLFIYLQLLVLRKGSEEPHISSRSPRS